MEKVVTLEVVNRFCDTSASSVVQSNVLLLKMIAILEGFVVNTLTH